MAVWIEDQPSDDLRGCDYLARMSLRMLRSVEQEPEHSRWKQGATNLPGFGERFDARFANLGERSIYCGLDRSNQGRSTFRW
jgi:hypothetical protein